jgi:hypothetical protein
MSAATAKKTQKRSAAWRCIVILGSALLAFATRASAQDVFSSGSGSEGDNGQSCQETYTDTTNQIAEARALIDADFKKQEIGCNGDPGCRESAGKEYVEQIQELAKQHADAEAQYNICKIAESGGNGGAPAASGGRAGIPAVPGGNGGMPASAGLNPGTPTSSGGNRGAPSNPPGTPQNPLRGYVSNEPQRPNTRNNQPPLVPPNVMQALDRAAGSLFPGGSQGLQKAGAAAKQNERAINNALNDASRRAIQNENAINQAVNDVDRKTKVIADNMRQDLINKWTHPMDPGTAFKEVFDAWAGNAVGAGIGGGLGAGLKGAGIGKALKAAASAAAEEGATTAGLGRALKASAPSNGGQPEQQQQASNGQQSPPNSESGPSAGGNEFPAAPPPLQRGMLPEVDDTLRKIAAEKGWTIVVRDGNPGATRFYGEPGYLPKGPGLKAKTTPYDPAKPLSEQPNAGLARSDEPLPEDATKLGYSTEPETGLVTQGGNRFHSDIDLHGVYDSAGNDVTSEFFKEIIKKQYRGNPIQDMIQHGTHDTWMFKNDPIKAGSNYGPQAGGGKTVTAYTPGGSTVQLSSTPQMKSFYTENNINWSRIYPNH